MVTSTVAVLIVEGGTSHSPPGGMVVVRLERETAAFHWSFPNWPVHIIIGTLLYGQPCPCYALIWKPMILLALQV